MTLARARPVISNKFRATVAEATSDLWPGAMFAPPDFVLMDSQLSPQGSRYTPLARFPIGGA